MAIRTTLLAADGDPNFRSNGPTADGSVPNDGVSVPTVVGHMQRDSLFTGGFSVGKGLDQQKWNSFVRFNLTEIDENAFYYGVQFRFTAALLSPALQGTELRLAYIRETYRQEYKDPSEDEGFGGFNSDNYPTSGDWPFFTGPGAGVDNVLPQAVQGAGAAISPGFFIGLNSWFPGVVKTFGAGIASNYALGWPAQQSLAHWRNTFGRRTIAIGLDTPGLPPAGGLAGLTQGFEIRSAHDLVENTPPLLRVLWDDWFPLWIDVAPDATIPVGVAYIYVFLATIELSFSGPTYTIEVQDPDIITTNPDDRPQFVFGRVFAWTPEQAGTFTFTVRASRTTVANPVQGIDERTYFVEHTWTVVVQPAPGPAIATGKLEDSVEGEAMLEGAVSSEVELDQAVAADSLLEDAIATESELEQSVEAAAKLELSVKAKAILE